MLTNSMALPLESGRPRFVWAIGTISACAPRLWLATLGKLEPGYGRLCHVALSRTSIFGTLYDASPLTLVRKPDSRWQYACGSCASAPRVPPQPKLEMYVSGWALATPHSS